MDEPKLSMIQLCMNKCFEYHILYVPLSVHLMAEKVLDLLSKNKENKFTPLTNNSYAVLNFLHFSLVHVAEKN